MVAGNSPPDLEAALHEIETLKRELAERRRRFEFELKLLDLAPAFGDEDDSLFVVGASRRVGCGCRTLPRARARTRRVLADFGSVFGALTQNRSTLEPSLGFAATAGTPRF
jgi:hypothetical protein